MNHQFLTILFVVSLPFVSGGATCRRLSQPSVPAVFVAPPSMQDVISAVNDNTQRIQQLQTESASLTVAGLPAKLRANIAVESPHRFRLQGKLLGPELDLGSNEELFWFWAKSDPDKAFYFARHADYARAGGPRLLPLEPQWLIEAFGLVRLGEETLHEGPFPRGEGYVEIRSHLQTASGPMIRALVIDDTYGWIVQQTIADQQGRLLATVQASDHRPDPLSGAIVPHRIAINLPPANLSLQIDVAGYSINQLYTDPAELWTLPRIEGYTLVDLAGPGRPPLPSHLLNGPQHFEAPPHYQSHRSGFRPSYRGVTTVR